MLSESTQILTAPNSSQDKMQPISCPFCQNSIAAGDEYCSNCGFQRGSWPDSAAPDRTGNAMLANARWQLTASDGRSWPLPDGETLAGRGEVALRIEDGFISRQHVRLTAHDSSVELEDLGSANGTFVGGTRLQAGEKITVHDGSTLRLGSLELTLIRLAPASEQDTSDIADSTAVQTNADVVADRTDGFTGSVESATDAATPSRWTLQVAGHGDFPLPAGTITIGRRPDNDITLADGYVSGHHGQFTVADEQVSYTDLGSTNGSVVDGEIVAAQESRPLAAGSVLRFGQLEAVLICSAEDGLQAGEQIS